MKLKSLLNVALSAAVAASFMIAGSATAAPIKITGAGASFPAPIYSEWFKDFAKKPMAKSKWITSPSVPVAASKTSLATPLISVPVTQP
jgi:ABC-type phosphate transport system substrate-binding protein